MNSHSQNIKTKPPVILGLEASGEHASVAVTRGDDVLQELRLEQRHGHASQFVPLVKECLDNAELAFADLDIIAAGVGPGSFTGLRVCLSAAKGFAIAGGLTSIGVNGLRARAYGAQTQMPDNVSDIISCADTRRGSLFYQRFDCQLEAKSEIAEATMEELMSLASDDVLCVPPIDDFDKTAANINQNVHIVPMSASDIARVAFMDFQASKPLPPLDPLYVVAPKLGPSKSA